MYNIKINVYKYNINVLMFMTTSQRQFGIVWERGTQRPLSFLKPFIFESSHFGRLDHIIFSYPYNSRIFFAPATNPPSTII